MPYQRREAMMILRRLLPVLAACFISQVQAGDVRVEGKIISSTTSGPPLEVSSTDNVNNLNADKLDGFDVGDFATAGSGVGVHYKNLVGVPGKEIDQECAESVSGCFAGDSEGFPVTISEPGSYRLSSNLDVSFETNPEDVTAIEISASNVTLDLRGFLIRGGGGSGLGDGIHHTSGRSVVILNGLIEFMGDTGIIARNNSTIRNILSKSNGGAGIDCEFNCTVMKTRVIGNDGNGIITDAFARVSKNLSRGNGMDGIQVSQGSLVKDNVAINNSGDGLDISSTSTGYSGNVADNNSGAQINGGTAIGDNLCSGSIC